jgi:hypothetical protein
MRKTVNSNCDSHRACLLVSPEYADSTLVCFDDDLGLCIAVEVGDDQVADG